MRNQSRLRSFAAWQAIKKQRRLLGHDVAIYQLSDISTLFLAFVVNFFILLAGYAGEPDATAGEEGEEEEYPAKTKLPKTELMLGVLMVLSTFLTLLYRLVEVSSVRVQRAARAQSKELKRPLTFIEWCLAAPLWALSDTKLVWDLLLFAFAVLGVAWLPAFFALHLFDLAFKFEDLRKARRTARASHASLRPSLRPLSTSLPPSPHLP